MGIREILGLRVAHGIYKDCGVYMTPLYLWEAGRAVPQWSVAVSWLLVRRGFYIFCLLDHSVFL